MKKVLIIAEAGVNHNGSMENAFRLIEAAAVAGADYVKFQTFKAAKLVSKTAQQAEYQEKNMGGKSTQFEMLKKLEITEEQHYLLKAHAEKNNIRFLSTGFDEESVDFLDNLGIDFFKVPSGEITNYPYLKHIAAKKKPVILSTGMTTLGEIENAVNVLLNNGIPKQHIQILHCNTEYPTPMKDVNLHAMNTIKVAFGVGVGYSDHTLGIEIPVAAVALGAEVIEKHFTLDKEMEGPDHKASLNPVELEQMISAIRNVELAMAGDGYKQPSESEKKNMAVARKSIHLNKELAQGTVITEKDLLMIRPGDGISPFEMDKIVGRKAGKALQAFHKLSWSDIA
ncbi:N-acetylneuraminate synthase [Chitinophaga sp. LS1]|uniref:N-acetylneuraminate synthase n=1 Tax=Chitinophaga sp. LS1 TaxID=3051176 RepID=UPI002AABFA7E|nr:N-acetylneuraminate synthase [Chitinophaga sp. LS1]WPV64448.1 N-acetylneuraminate synthase [Chitinophaga sp. LS1]